MHERIMMMHRESFRGKATTVMFLQNEWMDGWTDGRTDRRTEDGREGGRKGWMDGRTDGRTDGGREGGRREGRRNGWMDGRTEGWEGQMDRQNTYYSLDELCRKEKQHRITEKHLSTGKSTQRQNKGRRRELAI